jgi:hypothetical protein
VVKLDNQRFIMLHSSEMGIDLGGNILDNEILCALMLGRNITQL